MRAARGGEKLAGSGAPSLVQRHAGQAGHEIQLRWPDVAKRRREGLRLAIEEPVMVRPRVLGHDVDLVEAEMDRTHVERDDGLARGKSLPRRNDDLDHE